MIVQRCFRRLLCDTISREAHGLYGWWPALDGSRFRTRLRFVSYLASFGAGVMVVLSSHNTQNNEKHVFSPVRQKNV